jgi:hypothetical protein
MARLVEAAAQRRKLIGEVARLAEIAIFGTLSETYRTCGRAGCHCQGDGPKHGPHLNVRNHTPAHVALKSTLSFIGPSTRNSAGSGEHCAGGPGWKPPSVP